ncbi:MAG: peptidase M23 [Cycloclasticus sp. symbiont of Poecilosclerida sp. M]|nr:MAG: peptidase M23 [Cycloclasticus sp. symbiont of Poecilosclerida sp. M]
MLCSFLLCCICVPLAAQKLYQYKDEQGIWRYTDKKPDTSQSYKTKQVKVSAQRRVWLENSGSKTAPEYMIRNTYPGPIEVAFKFITQNNVTASPTLPQSFIVDEGVSPALFQVSAANPRLNSNFKFEYSYTIGSPDARHSPNTQYIPPIAPNSQFRISQSFNGAYTHKDEQNKYAVDIAMPINTPIHAARSGVVMHVESDFFNSGTKQGYKSRANSIRILHDDGTMAIYAHLALEKLVVHPGLYVNAGQLIGYSGNTGYTTGPHLHFAVQVNKGMRLSAIPFKFKTQSGESATPKAGAILHGEIQF